MYQTYKYVDNKIEIINEYDDLLEAYKSIDTQCEIYPFTEYYLSLFNNLITVSEFTTSYYNKIINIEKSINDLVKYDIKDVIALFVGLENKQDIPYFILNDKNYLVDLNNIIEEELELTTFIKVNPDIIFNDLKEYFKNHINEFLYIVDVLIENLLYDHFPWRKNLKATIEANSNELQYNKLYKNNDIYNRIEYNEIYSSSEYDTLQDFITDLDHIVRVLMDNIYIISKELQITPGLKNILRYL